MEASKKEPNVLQTYEELKTEFEFENYVCRIDDILLLSRLDRDQSRPYSTAFLFFLT